MSDLVGKTNRLFSHAKAAVVYGTSKLSRVAEYLVYCWGPLLVHDTILDNIVTEKKKEI